jgi:hypothetical protein
MCPWWGARSGLKDGSVAARLDVDVPMLLSRAWISLTRGLGTQVPFIVAVTAWSRARGLDSLFPHRSPRAVTLSRFLLTLEGAVHS